MSALSPRARAAKRGLDIAVSALALALLWPLIGAALIGARRDTGASGLFRQERIGRGGRPFTILKIRSIRPDGTISRYGAWLRASKIDELPQLWCVLRGRMSLVGPRPDLPGYLDRLEGEDRILLELRPGMTGPASLKYRDEARLLAAQADPKGHNDRVIWPDKVRINRRYAESWSLAGDIGYLIASVRPGTPRAPR